jgi:hypothetical protein
MGKSGSFLRDKTAEGVTLTTNLRLVPKSRNKWSYTSTPPILLHGVVLNLSKGKTLPLPLEILDEGYDINNAWESIRENNKTSSKVNQGYHRLKHNKP